MIVPILCRGLLWSLGWQIYKTGYLSSLFPDQRVVVLFSHSSYWDFILFLIYRLAYPEITNVYAIMKPQPFYYAGWILTRMGFIPATRLEDRGHGFVESTINQLDAKPQFKLMISPKGTIIKAPWRTGYYYLAKGLGAKVQVVGLDYQHRRITVFPPRPLKSLPETQAECQADMSQIVPLYPDQELHPERCYSRLFYLRPVIGFTLVALLIIYLC